MSSTGWTIDELAQRAVGALGSVGVHAPNGRITAAPDRRVIRWYATIGLLDRPLRTRGRTARYGERHLLQLVAVKRRQAEGRSLAEIQAELAGATDATLRRVAGLPAEPAGRADQADQSEPALEPTGHGRAQFWRAPAAPAPAPAAAAAPASVAGQDGGSPFPGPPDSAQPSYFRQRPAAAPEPFAEAELTANPAGRPDPIYPVALDEAVTLLLPARPTEDDLAAIHAAAGPLRELLAARGLLAQPPPSHRPSRHPGGRDEHCAHCDD